MKTELQASIDWICPVSLAFPASERSTCRGTSCAAWRFEKITTAHPLWKPAVLARAEEIGEKAPFAKASAWVAENKAALGMIPVVGYCGLGGAE